MNTNFEDNKTISDEEEEMKKGKNPKIAPQMARDSDESYHDNYGVIQHMDEGGMAQWVPGTSEYDQAVQANNGTDPYAAKMQALAKMLSPAQNPTQPPPNTDPLSIPSPPHNNINVPLLPAQGFPNQQGQAQNYPAQQYQQDTDNSDDPISPNYLANIAAKKAALAQLQKLHTNDNQNDASEDIDLSGYKTYKRAPVKVKKDDEDED